MEKGPLVGKNSRKWEVSVDVVATVLSAYLSRTTWN